MARSEPKTGSSPASLHGMVRTEITGTLPPKSVAPTDRNGWHG
ncbi:MAG TPA: hypothetical protein PLS00_03230 [Niabella sp.]|nr:hypothetical protein [Niabella sp.]